MRSLKTPFDKFCTVSFNCKTSKVKGSVVFQETYLVLYFTRTSVTILATLFLHVTWVTPKQMKIFKDAESNSRKLTEEFLQRSKCKMAEYSFLIHKNALKIANSVDFFLQLQPQIRISYVANFKLHKSANVGPSLWVNRFEVIFQKSDYLAKNVIQPNIGDI